MGEAHKEGNGGGGAGRQQVGRDHEIGDLEISEGGGGEVVGGRTRTVPFREVRYKYKIGIVAS